jgi:hypothetical protein
MLLPGCLDHVVDDSNPVRAIDAFVDALDLAQLGFDGVSPAATGRRPIIPRFAEGYLTGSVEPAALERSCEGLAAANCAHNDGKETPKPWSFHDSSDLRFPRRT